jgi:hypothetical protein
MTLFRRVRTWLGKLVHRLPDLFDIASGLVTPAFVVLTAWNISHNDLSASEVGPSLSFLPGVAPLWFWLGITGLAGALQPVVLWLDDPHDPRPPVFQATKLARVGLAAIVGCFFFILLWSLARRVGPHQVMALYGLMIGMSWYITSHVLTREGPHEP